MAAIDKGEYGVFPSKYESLSCSDTTAKSSELKALLCSHSIGKNVILQGSKRVIPFCYKMNYIGDDEFLLLYTSDESQNLELPYDSFSEFDFENFSDECLAQFGL